MTDLPPSAIRSHRALNHFRQYPEDYAESILKVHWTPKQIEIAHSFRDNKYTFVKASHTVGKTFLGGGLVNWYFDVFPRSITITTAPTKEAVEDNMWMNIRVQRRGREGLMPAAPRMEYADDWFAVGTTASTGEAFQGKHSEYLSLFFDEAVGIQRQFWTTGSTMVSAPTCRWIAFMNPTDTASHAYREQQTGKWNVITLSALDHPNVVAELNGLAAPYPGAVRLEWVEQMIADECEQVSYTDRIFSDFEFKGGIYRPNAIFESRVLGRWPSSASDAIWSEALWDRCVDPNKQQPVPQRKLEIGCDVARFGDDYTVIIAKRGPCVIYHEYRNGWKITRTAQRLKEIAQELSQPGEDPRTAVIRIDDGGVGGGVVDMADGFNFIPVNAGSKAINKIDYPRKRSELWFNTAQMAAEGLVDLTRLSKESQTLLRAQLMSPTWKQDSAGRRVVEEKAQTKKRLKASPDHADALNLCFDATRSAIVLVSESRFLSANQQSSSDLDSAFDMQGMFTDYDAESADRFKLRY